MSRRSTPERIYAAQRAGVVQRLTGEGELPDRAEAKVAAWEARTVGDGRTRDGAYWDAGYRWITDADGQEPQSRRPLERSARQWR